MCLLLLRYFQQEGAVDLRGRILYNREMRMQNRTGRRHGCRNRPVGFIAVLLLQSCAVRINHLPTTDSPLSLATSSVSNSICSGAALTNTPYAGGSGSVVDPYIICTAAQLDQIGQRTADYSSNFALEADVDLSSYTGNSFHAPGVVGTPWACPSLS